MYDGYFYNSGGIISFDNSANVLLNYYLNYAI